MFAPYCFKKQLVVKCDYHTCHDSPGYDNNLLPSYMGQQISQIKSSYELSFALIWNLSHFLPKFDFSLISQSSFTGAFSPHVFHQSVTKIISPLQS